MLIDLVTTIQEWQNKGDRIILLADMNNDVSGSTIQEFCCMTNLVEAIHSLHGWAKMPMHQRGSTAIDRIFMSPSLLEAAQGGFLCFGEVTISNHRVVWLDVPAASFGFDCPNQVTRPVGQRLKCKEPRNVLKYNTTLNHFIQEHNLIMKIQLVYQEGINPMMAGQIEQYTMVNWQYVEIQLAAEQQCWKLYAGKIP